MRDGLMRFSAFTTDPAGGNPAGVWIGDTLPDVETMQRVATALGDSETAFIARDPSSPDDPLARLVRYYSPRAEVPFCGHATIASGVALGGLDGAGRYRFSTRAGLVMVEVEAKNAEGFEASLTSVEPRHEPAPDALVDAALAALGWRRDELDPSIPPARAYAGAWHLVLAAATRERLDALRYEFDGLERLMRDDDLTTLQLVWRQVDRDPGRVFHARNPFPVGGVVEDPATGAAAAALGGYLRDAGLLESPARFLIRQGEAMGRPSRLEVDVPATGGIVVRGAAVPLNLPAELG